MAELTVSTVVPCPPEKVENVLHTHGFLAAFVDLQHPTDPQIVANQPPDQSTAAWRTQLPGGLPRLVKRLVGDAISLELLIQTSPTGRLRLDAAGRFHGSLDAALLLRPHGDETAVEVSGRISVSAGPLSAPAEKLARNYVIDEVLLGQFFPLLSTWCSRARC